MSETLRPQPTPLPEGAVPSTARIRRGSLEIGALSDRRLAMAEAHQIARALSAEFAHFLIGGALFVKGFLEWWYGLRDELDWDPDPHGQDAQLDELERDAKANLRAIHDEMGLRRARRQQVHEWRREAE